MVINGLGFTPRRNDKGNVDKKRNKLWVRFVDYETKEELAPRYEVK